MMPSSSVRVVVKLPYVRPENPPNDPPKIEWTSEKADILWKVIERSRSVDSAGADWKGLAAHLKVPLPYLLYRVNARFQEDIRGLRDIQGALSPTSPHGQIQSQQQQHRSHELPERPTHQTLAARVAMVDSDRLSNSRIGLGSMRLGVRAKLNSLGANSPRPKQATSSSTLTLQTPRKSFAPMEPTSPSTDSPSDSEDEDMKEEEALRNAEQEEALAKKLADLQKMMTVDAIGLVAGTRPRDKGKSRDTRGRSLPMSPRSVGSLSSRVESTLSSRSASQSVSAASSPQGSIPEISSTSGDSQPHSPKQKNFSHKSASPPSLLTRGPLGHAHRRLTDRGASDFGSSHGSEASSFSDLSDASISASALESALMSNLGNNGSRFSQFATRSRSHRQYSVVPQ